LRVSRIADFRQRAASSVAFTAPAVGDTAVGCICFPTGRQGNYRLAAELISRRILDPFPVHADRDRALTDVGGRYLSSAIFRRKLRCVRIGRRTCCWFAFTALAN
jgi:hypothetical protein